MYLDLAPHSLQESLSEWLDDEISLDLALERALDEWFDSDVREDRTRSTSQTRPTYDWLGIESAQYIMDELQKALDSGEDDPVQRKNHLGLLRFLSRKFQILPLSLMVQNVQREGRNPVAGGGFADIWRGVLQEEPVCLKVLRLVVEQDTQIQDTLRKEFCHEALIWRQLRHPNILPLLGVDVDLFSPSFCLVSPWMENKDIITYLKQNPDHRIHTVLTEVAAGLRYLHSGINPPLVHGDIRGANILVTDDRRCCLADFGLSVMTTSSQAWTITTSSTFAARGTMRWLAPEYVLTSEIPNHPSRDVYAFGCTMLEIFTQKPPFSDHKNEAAVLLHLVGGGRPVRPKDIWYPDAIWDLTTLCWAQNFEERPSADQISKTLNETMFGPPPLWMITIMPISYFSSWSHTSDRNSTIEPLPSVLSAMVPLLTLSLRSTIVMDRCMPHSLQWKSVQLMELGLTLVNILRVVSRVSLLLRTRLQLPVKGVDVISLPKIPYPIYVPLALSSIQGQSPLSPPPLSASTISDGKTFARSHYQSAESEGARRPQNGRHREHNDFIPSPPAPPLSS